MPKSQVSAPLAPDLLDRLKARFGAYPLIQDWCVSIDEVAPGHARMRLGPSPVVMNLLGTVNGGVQATLCDMVCAVALCTVFDGAMPFATSDLHIRYLEPAVGEIRAEAEVVRHSPRSAIIQCRLSCGSKVVALCTTHFAIKRQRS